MDPEALPAPLGPSPTGPAHGVTLTPTHPVTLLCPQRGGTPARGAAGPSRGAQGGTRSPGQTETFKERLSIPRRGWAAAAPGERCGALRSR